MLENIFVPALVSIVVFILAMLLNSLFGNKGNVQDRVRRMAVDPGLQENDPTLNALYNEEKTSDIANIMSGMLALLGTNIEKFRKTNQMRFYRAGVMSVNGPIFYLFFKRYGLVIFLLLAYLFATLPGEGMMRIMHYIIAGLFLIAAVFGPDLFLSNQETKRKKVLLRAFPDTLDLLLVCVESGLAIDGALSRVCKELTRAYPEMTLELNRTRLELTMLNDRSQALTNLAERTDMLCFRALTTTLLQSEKFGTSLTDTLRVLSEDYRNTRLMIAEEKAGRLPVLMTVPLIMLMMPALFLVILGPTILRAMHLGPVG